MLGKKGKKATVSTRSTRSSGGRRSSGARRGDSDNGSEDGEESEVGVVGMSVLVHVVYDCYLLAPSGCLFCCFSLNCSLFNF